MGGQNRAAPALLWHAENRVQFNVNNLLDKHYVTFSRGVGMTREWELSDRLSF